MEELASKTVLWLLLTLPLVPSVGGETLLAEDEVYYILLRVAVGDLQNAVSVPV